jgi:hypothetical protein
MAGHYLPTILNASDELAYIGRCTGRCVRETGWVGSTGLNSGDGHGPLLSVSNNLNFYAERDVVAVLAITKSRYAHKA